MEMDISTLIEPGFRALTGRDNGNKSFSIASEKYKLEELEKNNQEIIIIIPEKIVTMNRSFFLGFFEIIIERLGKAKFESIYKFKCSKHINDKLPGYIMSAILKTPTLKNFS